jgi:hypothetical protein
MKKNILITSGIVVLVLLLAGAALIGGRLLNGQPISGGGFNLFPGGGNGRQEVRINADDIQPAKELPQTPADVRGLFDRRENNSIYVGTGQVTMMVQRDQSGNVESSSNATGPTVEIVVTNDTIVYHDTTLEQYNGQPPAGEKIQQVVEPGSLDDIGENSTITVWGKKTGDRVIADILVYTTPAFFER